MQPQDVPDSTAENGLDKLLRLKDFPATTQAHSSGVERYLDTVEVGGSKPPAPMNMSQSDMRIAHGKP